MTSRVSRRTPTTPKLHPKRSNLSDVKMRYLSGARTHPEASGTTVSYGCFKILECPSKVDEFHITMHRYHCQVPSVQNTGPKNLFCIFGNRGCRKEEKFGESFDVLGELMLGSYIT